MPGWPLLPGGHRQWPRSPCPAGTYSSALALYHVDQCSSCPAGYYCFRGISAISGACAAGHYCLANTNAATDNPCAAGRYSLVPHRLKRRMSVPSWTLGIMPSVVVLLKWRVQPVNILGVPGTEDYHKQPRYVNYCWWECSAGYYCAGSSAMTQCGVGTTQHQVHLLA